MKKTLPSFPVHLLSQLRYFLGVDHSLPRIQQINPPKAEWAQSALIKIFLLVKWFIRNKQAWGGLIHC